MAELISSGVGLMIAGMGIVFLFLALLVVAINVMSAVVRRFFPEQPTPEKLANIGTDKATVAAISAAVHQYRAKNK